MDNLLIQSAPKSPKPPKPLDEQPVVTRRRVTLPSASIEQVKKQEGSLPRIYRQGRAMRTSKVEITRTVDTGNIRLAYQEGSRKTQEALSSANGALSRIRTATKINCDLPLKTLISQIASKEEAIQILEERIQALSNDVSEKELSFQNPNLSSPVLETNDVSEAISNIRVSTEEFKAESRRFEEETRQLHRSLQAELSEKTAQLDRKQEQRDSLKAELETKLGGARQGEMTCKKISHRYFEEKDLEEVRALHTRVKSCKSDLNIWKIKEILEQAKTIRGCLWTKEEVAAVMHDTKLAALKHAQGLPWATVVPFHIFTTSWNKQSVWLSNASDPNSWSLLKDPLYPMQMRDLFQELPIDGAWKGLKCFKDDGVKLLCYERTPHDTLLSDCVLWIPSPRIAFPQQGKPWVTEHRPSPSVLEYIMSQKSTEIHSNTSTAEQQWSVEPFVDPEIDELVMRCKSLPNQHAVDLSVISNLRELLSDNVNRPIQLPSAVNFTLIKGTFLGTSKDPITAHITTCGFRSSTKPNPHAVSPDPIWNESFTLPVQTLQSGSTCGLRCAPLFSLDEAPPYCLVLATCPTEQYLQELSGRPATVCFHGMVISGQTSLLSITAAQVCTASGVSPEEALATCFNESGFIPGETPPPAIVLLSCNVPVKEASREVALCLASMQVEVPFQCFTCKSSAGGEKLSGAVASIVWAPNSVEVGTGFIETLEGFDLQTLLSSSSLCDTVCIGVCYESSFGSVVEGWKEILPKDCVVFGGECEGVTGCTVAVICSPCETGPTAWQPIKVDMLFTQSDVNMAQATATIPFSMLRKAVVSPQQFTVPIVVNKKHAEIDLSISSVEPPPGVSLPCMLLKAMIETTHGCIEHLSPGDITEALSFQVLHWNKRKTYILSLSGHNKVIAEYVSHPVSTPNGEELTFSKEPANASDHCEYCGDAIRPQSGFYYYYPCAAAMKVLCKVCGFKGHVVKLERHRNPCDVQYNELIAHTVQNKDVLPYIKVLQGDVHGGEYVARNPKERDLAKLVFECGPSRVATWCAEKREFKLNTGDKAGPVEINMASWMLPFVDPFCKLLSEAVENLPLVNGSKSFRWCEAWAALSIPGKLLTNRGTLSTARWGIYNKAHAKPVMVLGKTGVDISKWSRYQREGEVVFKAGSLFCCEMMNKVPVLHQIDGRQASQMAVRRLIHEATTERQVRALIKANNALSEGGVLSLDIEESSTEYRYEYRTKPTSNFLPLHDAALGKLFVDSWHSDTSSVHDPKLTNHVVTLLGLKPRQVIRSLSASSDGRWYEATFPAPFLLKEIRLMKTWGDAWKLEVQLLEQGAWTTIFSDLVDVMNGETHVHPLMLVSAGVRVSNKRGMRVQITAENPLDIPTMVVMREATGVRRRRVVCDCLRDGRALCKFEVREVSVGVDELLDEGAVAIAGALDLGVSIREVSLRNHGITASGGVALLQSLRVNTNVQELCIDDPEVTDAETLDTKRAINLRLAYNKLSTVPFNLLSNLGSNWPAVAALALHDVPSVSFDLSSSRPSKSEFDTHWKEFCELFAAWGGTPPSYPDF